MSTDTSPLPLPSSAARSRRQEKILQKQKLNPTTPKTNFSPFRAAERHYKKADIALSENFSNVLDLESEQSRNSHPARIVEVELSSKLDDELFGTLEADQSCKLATNRRTRGYTIPTVPGLIIIPNVFTPCAQRRVIEACIAEYAKDPNLSNLHTHYQMPPDGLWQLVRDEATQKTNIRKGFSPATDEEDADLYVQLKKADPASLYSSDTSAARQPTAAYSNTKQDLGTEKRPPPPSTTVPILPPLELFRRLRWVTLGYQYHWPTKSYHFDKRYPFPTMISDLAKNVAIAVEGVAGNPFPGKEYRPEAGVVNYYQLKDTLMAHVDKSELNTVAPLVSFSFGHTCVFVIGEITDQEPISLYLRSGDVLVMTGTSRGFFHGVPRILEGTLPPFLSNMANHKEDSEMRLIGEYMKQARINVNVRQVFNY